MEDSGVICMSDGFQLPDSTEQGNNNGYSLSQGSCIGKDEGNSHSGGPQLP